MSDYTVSPFKLFNSTSTSTSHTRLKYKRALQSGSYGSISLYTDKETSKYVAIKKSILPPIPLHKHVDPIPSSDLIEHMALRQLQPYPYIVPLVGIRYEKSIGTSTPLSSKLPHSSIYLATPSSCTVDPSTSSTPSTSTPQDVSPFTTPFVPHIIMEYEPSTIHDLIYRPNLAKCKLDSDAKDLQRMILFQLSQALRYCHLNSILHRDLKPINVLLTRDWNVKLADFGTAKFLKTGYERDKCAYTLEYKAPEILLGSTRYGPPADIWALGSIMWEWGHAWSFLRISETSSPSLKITNLTDHRDHVPFQLPQHPFSTNVRKTASRNQFDQLMSIFACFGSPSLTSSVEIHAWPNVVTYPSYIPSWPRFKPTITPKTISRLFGKGFNPKLDADYIDLMFTCLRYDPLQRQSSTHILSHPYFKPILHLLKPAPSTIPPIPSSFVFPTNPIDMCTDIMLSELPQKWCSLTSAVTFHSSESLSDKMLEYKFNWSQSIKRMTDILTNTYKLSNASTAIRLLQEVLLRYEMYTQKQYITKTTTSLFNTNILFPCHIRFLEDLCMYIATKITSGKILIQFSYTSSSQLEFLHFIQWCL